MRSFPLRPRLLPLVTLSLLALPPGLVPVRAEVVRFEIERREPFADGRSFGDVGPYERIVGRVYYELDPEHPANRGVVDLEHAPRNERGRVEFFGDLFILAPKSLERGNGAVFYDVNNRGNKLALRFFNDGGGGNDPRTAADAGNGFLMRQGYTVVWSGWDGELLPGNDRLRLATPVARPDSGPLTGLVRCEIVPDQDTQRMVVNWANHGSYRPTEQGLATATLTHRIRPGDPRQPIPSDRWTVHVTEGDGDPRSPLPKVELEFFGGLRQGEIYELIYEARDPLVHGVCFTALRDLISAFKHGLGQDNPLLVEGQPVIQRAHGFGVSQSGRFLREFLYWGFNEDEQERQVFDGLIPHVSGSGLGSFNHRFAQPTRHAAQHDHHDYPPDRFPFAYETQTDPVSGRTDGILRRCAKTGTCPLILHTQSTSEYWNRSGSLVHTDPLGERDASVPDNVRVFFFGGTQHGPGGFPPRRGDGLYAENPGDYRPFLRALLVALDRWAQGEQAAPPSVHPTIAAGTLVDWRQSATGFPDLPGVRYPQVIQQPDYLDFGPRWETERIVDRQPPVVRGHYRVLVPICDRDGNERDCLSPPEVAVPVATYTSWNLRGPQAGAEYELLSLKGSYLPFPVTKAERDQTNDPRRSLEERYQSLDDYLGRLKKECRRLERTGYLLAEDVPRILAVQRQRVEPLFE